MQQGGVNFGLRKQNPVINRVLLERGGWDSNPRWPGWTTTVFETAPIGRSGTPPLIEADYTKRIMGSKRRNIFS